MITNRIYVFDSNLAGRHMNGSALRAYREYGAVYGQAYGVQGTSFGIPTRDEDFKILSLTKIKNYVSSFIRYAELNPHITFQVTNIGGGVNGYDEKDIAELFKAAPLNCILPAGWRRK